MIKITLRSFWGCPEPWRRCFEDKTEVFRPISPTKRNTFSATIFLLIRVIPGLKAFKELPFEVLWTPEVFLSLWGRCLKVKTEICGKNHPQMKDTFSDSVSLVRVIPEPLWYLSGSFWAPVDVLKSFWTQSLLKPIQGPKRGFSRQRSKHLRKHFFGNNFCHFFLLPPVSNHLFSFRVDHLGRILD